jgi:hypothetical protein
MKITNSSAMSLMNYAGYSNCEQTGRSDIAKPPVEFRAMLACNCGTHRGNFDAWHI